MSAPVRAWPQDLPGPEGRTGDHLSTGVTGPMTMPFRPCSRDVRDRFMKVMRFEHVDTVPNMDFGYWTETLAAWHEQGLPDRITNDLEMEEYLDLDGTTRIPFIPVLWGVWPWGERKVLEERGHTLIIQDEEGTVCEVHKWSPSIPRYIKHAVESRHDWEVFKRERLDYTRGDRVLGDVKAFVDKTHAEGFPVRFNPGSLYGHLRNWMGVENISLAVLEDPDWVEEMMDHLVDMTLYQMEKTLPGAGVDMAWWWEDMCYNQGSLLTVSLFESMMVPRYRRITSELRKHGITLNVLDCDGRIFQLAPGWLEGGINCMFPIEAAHTDPLRLRGMFPEGMLMIGGVNKVELAKGRDAIDREVERLRPLVERGGYIPCVDHRVPPDVSYENYLYYIEKKQEILRR